jgi:bacillithiol system protein YtxJ
MGLFTRNTNNKKLDWQDLTSVDQLNELIQSGEKTLIFKHSTRCAISSMVLNQLENTWSGPQENIYFLDLLAYRDVSNQIAEELHVVHQSPQAIVFQGIEVLYHDSHSSISARAIEKALK